MQTDVYWKELELPRYWRPLAQPIAWALSAVLIIFWGTFVVFVQGLANLENLANTNGMFYSIFPPFNSQTNAYTGFEWLDSVINWSPVAYGLISGWLPAVLVIILFALLPKIIAMIVRARGVYTRSELQRSVLKIYFVFLVVNIFLISILGGSAIAILPQIVNSSGFEYVFLIFIVFLHCNNISLECSTFSAKLCPPSPLSSLTVSFFSKYKHTQFLTTTFDFW